MMETKLPSAPATNHSQHNSKWLKCLELEIRLINRKTESLFPGPKLDTWFLCQLEELITSHESELSEITHNVLPFDKDKHDFMEITTCTRVKTTLFNVSLKTSWLLHDQTSSPKVSGMFGVKLSRISSLSFDGSI